MISIHAPTWGATIHHVICPLLYVFQSTLPRGERPPCKTYRLPIRHFNPRSHVGSDYSLRHTFVSLMKFQSTLPRGERLHSAKDYCPVCKISIHAPTWGATFDVIRSSTIVIDFNPRSHVGSDSDHQIVSASIIDFNPRSHVGSDPLN